MTVYAINKRTKEHLVWDFRGPLPQPHDWRIVEADTDGWIPWDGDDECPLPDDARCELKFADGDVVGYSRAENVIWENYPSDTHEEHIIAYRPIRSEEDRAVDEIAMLLDCGKPPRHNAIELYRAGYRKVK